MKILNILTFVSLGSILFTSCLKDSGTEITRSYLEEDLKVLQKTLDIGEEEIDYSFTLPAHMSGVSGQFVNNAKAYLGRVLFYDKKLSKNNTVSCASCHHQESAFADNVSFSEGFAGEHTKRNALALGAVADFKTSYGGGNSFSGGGGINFFWDERAGSISEQSLLTIQDEVEMGVDNIDDLIAEVEAQDYYSILFRKAFPNEHITKHSITQALEEFINALNSKDTKFDKGMEVTGNPNGNFPNFTAQEEQGKSLYLLNCSSCHGSDMVRINRNKANNGLDENYEDKGIGDITGLDTDNGIFKVPVLRNIELTAPYMHDGRFATLEEVVEHYSTGIKAHSNLSPELREGFAGLPRNMNFNEEEKAALVAFLKTLTDPVLTNDPKFSNPFL